MTSKNLNFIREQAFKYWAGASGTNNIEEEWLFEGFATVESIHTPEELGLKISAPVN
ncbi:hypothetical protein [Fictibacillus sp. JL2B1089]|uniref:hypothetical protein n=1 Tax=Fictibacillus sp. JL2B1089 TaxID=3399565 RepID=UPI003A86B3F3